MTLMLFTTLIPILTLAKVKGDLNGNYKALQKQYSNTFVFHTGSHI